MIKCKIISVNTDKLKNDSKKFEEIGRGFRRYEKRREKMVNFINSFKSDSIEFEIVDAVTGFDIEVLEGNRLLHEDKIYNLDTNHFKEGCPPFYAVNVLSHMKIWKMDEDTLVLEDDILFEDGKFERLVNIIENFKKIKDANKVLYLQLSTPWLDNLGDKRFLSSPSEVEGLDLGLGKWPDSDWSGTTAYFITSDMKKFLLDNQQSLQGCDGYFGDLRIANLLRYYIPTDRSVMLRCDIETTLI